MKYTLHIALFFVATSFIASPAEAKIVSSIKHPQAVEVCTAKPPTQLPQKNKNPVVIEVPEAPYRGSGRR